MNRRLSAQPPPHSTSPVRLGGLSGWLVLGLLGSLGSLGLGGCADLDAGATANHTDSLGDAGTDADDAGPTVAMPGAVTMLTSARGPGVIRVASYNIEKNSAFEPNNPQAVRFLRLVKAIGADVWALQEVWSPPETVAAWFNSRMPLPNGATWTAVDGGSTMTVSSFPVVHHQSATSPDSGRKISLTWIDVPASLWSKDLYLINAHMTCCGDGELSRQREADSIAAWIQRVRGGKLPNPLPTATPLLLIGDLNLVGGPGPLHTLVTGDINDEASWGPDAAPDWDDTPLRDIRPHHNGDGDATWTWRWDGSGFNQKRLDCALLSDSVAEVVAAMVLNTTTLTQPQLDALGLAQLDVGKSKLGAGWVLDHLPLVIDLRLPESP